jgi:hypothetical protein
MGKLRGLLDTAAAVVQEKEKARMELESVAMEAVSLSYLLKKRGHAGPMRSRSPQTSPHALLLGSCCQAANEASVLAKIEAKERAKHDAKESLKAG